MGFKEELRNEKWNEWLEWSKRNQREAVWSWQVSGRPLREEVSEVMVVALKFFQERYKRREEDEIELSEKQESDEKTWEEERLKILTGVGEVVERTDEKLMEMLEALVVLEAKVELGVVGEKGLKMKGEVVQRGLVGAALVEKQRWEDIGSGGELIKPTDNSYQVRTLFAVLKKAAPQCSRRLEIDGETEYDEMFALLKRYGKEAWRVKVVRKRQTLRSQQLSSGSSHGEKVIPRVRERRSIAEDLRVEGDQQLAPPDPPRERRRSPRLRGEEPVAEVWAWPSGKNPSEGNANSDMKEEILEEISRGTEAGHLKDTMREVVQVVKDKRFRGARFGRKFCQRSEVIVGRAGAGTTPSPVLGRDVSNVEDTRVVGARVFRQNESDLGGVTEATGSVRPVLQGRGVVERSFREKPCSVHGRRRKKKSCQRSEKS